MKETRFSIGAGLASDRGDTRLCTAPAWFDDGCTGLLFLPVRTRPAGVPVDRRMKPSNTQEYPVTRQLLIPILLVASIWTAIGCAARKKEPVLGPIPANGFMKQWGATLDLSREGDEADRLFLRSDLLFLYTRKNRVYTFNAASGELLARNQVASPSSELRPPVLLGEQIVIPTISTLEVYDRKGRKVESIDAGRAVRSPAAVQGTFLYIGEDYAGGGRLVKLDIARPYGRTIWELMTFGAISAAPAVVEDGIYVASEDGRVYAVGLGRERLWAIEGNVFQTEGPILADVKGDDFGIYVASTDSKLYCLDRNTGRIKWTYFAGVPLRNAPIVIGDRIYLLVPGRGMVAINKMEGQTAREPLWVAPGATAFLSADGQNVYVLGTDNSVTALGKSDGQPRFRSSRRDLRVTGSNTVNTVIYVATRAGDVMGIQPVLKSGTVGQIVSDDRETSEPLARLDP